VHSFTNKAADSFNIPSVAYNAQADAQSWKDMLAHFEKTNN
jgi:dienelactone hydrolase